MKSHQEKGLEYFNDGFSCSQAVLASCSEKLGLDRDLAFRVSGAFGGGMGHINETCGAVTGALMLIGLKYGKFKKDDTVSKEKTYEIVAEYISAFKEKYGSIKCSDLIGFDLSKKEELQKARGAGVFGTICTAAVQSSIELVEKYLE